VNDISQLANAAARTNNVGGDVDDQGGNFVYIDNGRPAQGQTFTTGGNANGYALTASRWNKWPTKLMLFRDITPYLHHQSVRQHTASWLKKLLLRRKTGPTVNATSEQWAQRVPSGSPLYYLRLHP
jgi:hypothetical protein